jgi:hypothetical protein
MKKEKRLLLLDILKRIGRRRTASCRTMRPSANRIDQIGPKILGRIQAIRQIANPDSEAPGAGWHRDPFSGLWSRACANHNIVVLAGLSALAKWSQYGHADQGGSIRYLGVGTGYTTPSKSDTSLEAQLEIAEIDSWDNTNIDSDPVVEIATLMFLVDEANGDLMEAGLFQAIPASPSTGVMFCRGLFGMGLITNATKASPCVIESIGHGLAAGEKVKITGVSGMTELNDEDYFIDALTEDTLGLYSDAALATPVDSSAFTDYTDASPNTATWKVIIPKTTAEILTVNYSLTLPAE